MKHAAEMLGQSTALQRAASQKRFAVNFSDLSVSHYPAERDEIDFVDLAIDTLHVDRHRTLARTKLLLFVELNWSEGEILPVHGHMELMVFGIPDYVVEITFYAHRHGRLRGRAHLRRFPILGRLSLTAVPEIV